MPKISYVVRDLKATPEFLAKLAQKISDEPAAAPGQLRKKGEWYYLTYLKVVKIKDFDPNMWDLVEKEVNSIKAVIFRIDGGKLIVNGSKGEANEIQSYFEALAIDMVTPGSVAQTEHFSITDPTIDLASIIQTFEDKQIIEYVPKAKMKDVQLTLGTINSCMVNTKDFYDSVRKSITEDENCTGIEISLKEPAKTSVYFDTDGIVKVQTKSDIELEEFALRMARLEI